MKKVMFFLIAVSFSMMVFSQNKKVTDIKNSQLPKETQIYISKNLSGAIITRAAKIEEGSVFSYLAVVEIKGQKYACLFDKNGKFMGKDDKYLPTPSVLKPTVKTQESNPAPKSSAIDDTNPKKKDISDIMY